MESGKQMHRDIGSSRVLVNVRRSSSSVEQLEREILNMRIRENIEDSDDEKVHLLSSSIFFKSIFHISTFKLVKFLQDIKLDSSKGTDADSGHIIVTTIDDRDGTKQVSPQLNFPII